MAKLRSVSYLCLALDLVRARSWVVSDEGKYNYKKLRQIHKDKDKYIKMETNTNVVQVRSWAVSDEGNFVCVLFHTLFPTKGLCPMRGDGIIKRSRG